MREFELTEGLIDASCSQELRTLDVIMLGNNFSMSDAVAHAINVAVRGGVGLLNEFWTGQTEGWVHNPDIRDLNLAATPIFGFHAPPVCAQKWPGTVVAEDANLLPGLKQGRVLAVSACGPAFLPVSSARVMIMKNKIVDASEHGDPSLGALPMPGYLLGQLGKGPVAVVHCWNHAHFAGYVAKPAGQYLLNLISWLAGGKRES